MRVLWRPSLPSFASLARAPQNCSEGSKAPLHPPELPQRSLNLTNWRKNLIFWSQSLTLGGGRSWRLGCRAARACAVRSPRKLGYERRLLKRTMLHGVRAMLALPQIGLSAKLGCLVLRAVISGSSERRRPILAGQACRPPLQYEISKVPYPREKVATILACNTRRHVRGSSKNMHHKRRASLHLITGAAF